MENTFTYDPIEREGQTFHILTANEYPWINVQIIPFPEEKHDETIATLNAQPTIGWVIEHPGRRDFAVIHVGGNKVHLHITQANHEQVAADMQECMRNAARFWAEKPPT